MDGHKKLKMVQKSKYRWTLLAPSGKVIVEDIYCHTMEKAKEWIEAYISSWNDYSFELISKEEKK